MFLFLRLYLAHLIADFPLQLNGIYRLKLKGLAGTIPHSLIVFVCMAALSWPYLALPQLWLFLLFLAATHLVQDTVKIKVGSKNTFIPYVVDQLCHAGLIACVFLTDLSLTAPPAQSGIIARLYADNNLALLVIFLLLATYNGYFMIRCFNDTYFGRAHYNPCEKWYGIAERAVIVALIFMAGPALLLLPAVLVMRPLVRGLSGERCGLDKEFTSFRQTSLSWAVALACGTGALYAQAALGLAR